MKNKITHFETILNTYRKEQLNSSKEERVAVLLFSGGLDSVVTAAWLMRDLKMKLYPLFIDRGQGNMVAEKRAIRSYSNLFKSMYPSAFMPIKVIKAEIPPKILKQDLKLHIDTSGYPLRNPALQILAVQYASSLESSHKEMCRTVFTGTVVGDGFAHNSLASMRAMTLATCENMDDWSWIITSPNIDPIFNRLYDKVALIKWAAAQNIPLERTVSCGFARANTDHLHCGICDTCIRRKELFAAAGIEDKTVYANSP